MDSLLKFTTKGIYCPQGKIYIDPWKPVNKALITHCRADHSRPGHQHYLAHHHSESIMRQRLGHSIQIETIDYNKAITINGEKASFHPAGHIPGSAQIRMEYKGKVSVVSGDYKNAISLDTQFGIGQPFIECKKRKSIAQLPCLFFNTIELSQNCLSPIETN